jgi:hypothetical protein
MQTAQLAKLTDNESVDWGYVDIKLDGDKLIIYCNSKMIFKFAYDNFKQVLYVIFRSSKGTIYEYLGVPKNIFYDMAHAKSKGKYLNANVKKIYPYQKRIDIPPF